MHSPNIKKQKESINNESTVHLKIIHISKILILEKFDRRSRA